MSTSKAANIDEYIAGFPRDVQTLLQQVRTAVKTAAPGAEEMISYAIPAFRFEGHYLIYFAGFKNHIGLYPVPSGPEWEKEFSGYKTSGKGTIQFPLNKAIPLELITKIVRYRMQENLKKGMKRKKRE